MSKFFNELKRRHVIKAAIAYLVVAWVLLQVASMLLDTFHSPDWIKQAFTIFLIIGLPIWIVISWIYDFTPKGIEKTSDKPEDQVIKQLTGRRLNLFIIVSLSIAVVLLILRPSLFSTDSNTEFLIAVLPFDNIKVDQDKEWMSTNFPQNIKSHISKVQELKVIDSYSARQIKDSDKSVIEIAEELGISHILTGGVTQLNDKISITIELFDVVSKTVDWSESYDERLGDDYLELQQEISKKIVANLKVALNQSDEVALDNELTNSQEANIYFNEGVRNADNRGNNQSLLIESVNLFQKAIDLDPNYAEAYAEMAFVLRLVSSKNKIFENRDQVKTIDSLVKKALEIDPNSARAYTVLAAVELYRNEDYNKAKEYLDKANSIKPNDATTQLYYSLYYVSIPEKDFQNALKHITLAYRLNPFSNPIRANLIGNLLNVGKIEEAEVFFNKNSHDLPVFLRRILNVDIIDAKTKKACIEKKDWSEAIPLYQQAIERDSTNSNLYMRLAEAYRNILNDNVNYVFYAKKTYETGKLHEQNMAGRGYSNNAYLYYTSLLKTKQFEEADQLISDPYFSSLFSDNARSFLVFNYQYYSENYDPAEKFIENFNFGNYIDIALTNAQQNDIKGVRSILDKDVLAPSQKALVFAVLNERDSMYYYIDKEKDIYNVFKFNGAVEVDPYRKEERYKAFLKKNYLPLTHLNE
ncbi:MAG: hypothetical protein KJO00_05335 [Bacteroidia bacterium]|nr:hypothetical protein [Bacteroidia bacterium]